MAITAKPKPLPSELDYVPANSAPYKVKGGDSWYTLAERSEVRTAGMSANDLCFFNFKTRKPPEINWYLYHKVGTRQTTADGKNYVFSAGDTPGVIYLPKVGPPQPVNVVKPNQAADRLNMWFGVGGKAGTMVGPVGIETLVGWVVSLDDPPNGMAVTSTIHRLGLGAGVTAGVTLIYISEVRTPGQLNGHLQGDWDFNLSLGGNWGKVATAAVKVKQLQPLINIILKTGAKTPAALKKYLKANPDKYVELIKAGKTLKDALDLGTEPNVLVIDLPIGGGVEVSAFYGVSEFNAVWDNAD